MKELIIKILKMFAGKAVNNIENGTSATTQEAVKSAASETAKSIASETFKATGNTIKSVATSTTKAAIGSAATAAAGSIGTALLPILGTTLAIAALSGGIFAMVKYTSKGPTIDQTANVVEKIRTISEFTSACYYEEAVLKSSKVEAGKQNKLMKLANIEADSVYSELVIVAKGTVRAGYDLSKIPADQIKINGDSISLVVPKPEIFDVIVNPSNYEMYVEEGKWSHDEVSALQADYRETLTANSLESGLLEKADKSGQERLKTFLQGLGFSYVELKAN